MTEQPRSPEVGYWVNQIATYDQKFGQWERRGKKIVKRYKDERSGGDNSRSQFNILWSNVQTLGPALYAKNPVPNVDRRFQDDDKLGTVSAQALERAVSYFIDSDLFGAVMRQSVTDRLLAGRGTAWVRYVPNFRDVAVEGPDEVKQEGVQTTDDEQVGEEVEQELYSEEVVLDYVHWEDFGHSWGRTWEEVPAVWRKVYMSRKEMQDRGFQDWKEVPLDGSRKDDTPTTEQSRKATVYEIWDKSKREVIWIHRGMENPLDKVKDPLGLKGFFPCPKPLYATLANDNLIPTPDFIQYQDQAKELDDLTGRINALTKALKLAGVYDSSAEGVQRLLSEGVENQLIPVQQWAVFGEKGGLKGVIDFLPIKEIVEVLVALYESREKAKQDLYEITGISDIIRGQSDPRETLGAQQLKGKYAGLRLDNMQGEVARFSRDLVRIFAEIIAEHFSLETIQQISGLKLPTIAEKQMLMAKAQAGQATEEEQEKLDQPAWEEVHELIKNDTLRCFRISIETDSTIKADQDAEKQARVELLTAAGSFIQQAVQVPNPELQPLLMEMLMFGIRGFKVGRDMESTFEVALKKTRQKTENPPEPQPDPEMQKLQAQMQLDGQKLQLEGQKAQGEQAIKGQELQLEAQRMQAELSLKSKELELKQAELQMKGREMQIREHEVTSRTQLEGEKFGLEKYNAELAGKEQEAVANMPEIVQALLSIRESDDNRIEALREVVGMLNDTIKEMKRPKSIKVQRGKDGKIIGGVQE